MQKSDRWLMYLSIHSINHLSNYLSSTYCTPVLCWELSEQEDIIHCSQGAHIPFIRTQPHGHIKSGGMLESSRVHVARLIQHQSKFRISLTKETERGSWWTGSHLCCKYTENTDFSFRRHSYQSKLSGQLFVVQPSSTCQNIGFQNWPE